MAKVTWANFVGSDKFFCSVSISKSGSFKNTFATITILSELSLRHKRFILLVQRSERSYFNELWQQDKYLGGNYMFKVNRNTRTRCEICPKLTTKTPERRHWCRSGVFIVNFEHISQLVLVFLLLTLRR